MDTSQFWPLWPLLASNTREHWLILWSSPPLAFLDATYSCFSSLLTDSFFSDSYEEFSSYGCSFNVTGSSEIRLGPFLCSLSTISSLPIASINQLPSVVNHQKFQSRPLLSSWHLCSPASWRSSGWQPTQAPQHLTRPTSNTSLPPLTLTKVLAIYSHCLLPVPSAI